MSSIPMEPQDLIKNFLDQVRRLRLKAQVLQGTYTLLAYLLGSYISACLLVLIYQPATKWAWPLVGIFFLGLIYILFIKFIKILFVPFSRDDAALLTDSRYPHLNNALINSSQLSRRINQPNIKNIKSLDFIHELHRRTVPLIKKIDTSTVIDSSRIYIARNWFLGTLASLALAVIFIPDFYKTGHESWKNLKTPPEVPRAQIMNKKQTNPRLAIGNYSIESIGLTSYFPSYTGMKPKHIKPSDGTIQVLPGTEVKIYAKTNNPLIGASLVFNGKDNFIMNKETATEIKGNLLVKEKGFYQFNVKDQKGSKHLLAKKYPVTLDKDRSPKIVLFLTNPKPVYFANDKVNFFYEGKDDFGINSVELMAFINGKIKVIPVKSLKKQDKKIKDSYIWPLAQVDLKPGDEVQYYLEIKDNDNVFGPNTGQSESYSFTIFDSKKEMENLIAMQEKITEKMIALLATGLVKGASLKNQPSNLLGWKKLFITNVDELIQIVGLAKQIHDRGELINQFPQAYLNLLKNIIDGLSHIRKNQIGVLDDLQNKIHKPTQAKFEANSPYALSNERMTDHLEKDILLLVKMTNKQKLRGIMELEGELNELTQTLREELEKIKDGTPPKNPNELKNKIDKIRKTLQKLLSQLNQQTRSMPNEFLNLDAFKSFNMEGFSNTLEKIQNMIKQGQIGKALERLEQIQKDLQLLANQINRTDSETNNFLDLETLEALEKTGNKIDLLINKQQKIVKETTQINQKIRQQQTKTFKSQLNKLFTDLLRDVDAVRDLLKQDEKFLKNHKIMKKLESLIDKEIELNRKIRKRRQATVNPNTSDKLNQNFQKLNEDRKNQSSITQEKKSLGVNEFQQFKEALPQLLKKYDSLNDLAELQDLKEFATHFKQTYPDILRWQNRIRSTPNLRQDLLDRINIDLKQAAQINNEISKKLGSMMHSIRENYASKITNKQKSQLNQMAKKEDQMGGETVELSQLLDQLSRKNPMIPPELSRRMRQTGRHLERAEKNLKNQNIKESIESENQALKGLNDTSEILNQIKNSDDKSGRAQRQTPRKLGTGSSRDSRRGGFQKMQKERVLLPSEDQYHAPKEFREEILNAMKGKTPKDYQRMVMEYYKNLVK